MARFRAKCHYITDYCVPSLVLLYLNSIVVNCLDLSVKSVSLVNIFTTSTAMRKLTYLILSSHPEINLFLRSVRFLKYSVDALLLHLFVLTRLVHSNIVSYLVA